MKSYSKIDTLLERDPNTHKVVEQFRRAEFVAIKDWVVTEKIDGTNIRLVFYYSEERGETAFTIKGRTDDAQIQTGLLTVLHGLCQRIAPEVSKIIAEHELTAYTLYGEGYGPKIQHGGGDYREDPGFILFDVRAGDGVHGWLSPNDVTDAAFRLGIDRVPVLGHFMSTPRIIDLVRDGFKSRLETAKNVKMAEGVVAVPFVPLYDRRGERVMWKLKTRDFA